jgi:hypothetical protein
MYTIPLESHEEVGLWVLHAAQKEGRNKPPKVRRVSPIFFNALLY